MKRKAIICLFLIVSILCALNSVCAEIKIPSDVKPEYKYDTTDKSIVTIKKRLKDLGYFTSKAVFNDFVGEPLKKAVKEFQKNNNLKQDAKLNMKLFTVLFSDEAIGKNNIKVSNVHTVSSNPNVKTMQSQAKNKDETSSNAGTSIFIIVFIGVIFLKLLSPFLKGVILYNSNKRLSAIDNMDGITFEYWCAEMLKRLGFTSVRVTKATGDFGADIICFNGVDKVVVQCKRYSKNVNLKSIQEILGARVHYGASVMMVITNSYFASSAIQLARETGVILVDRTDLQRNIRIINGQYRKEKRKARKNKVL